ncbi:MAG: type II toxin-antitoxin system RelE/ParE family toxin [Sulfurimonas sp.]|uniref:type II toxin-antitoxin system RelE/ParE family toxin n=1 Tax=Sulfurimonas sp. TaxID=2022749 RepID=UPI0026179F5A|nr:type II toxin-antitoxin system RelE/ParE family toxin [Sulfurimonas sp.]MDD2652884.1 type II toxin-antitoxin system RelE/ParE family toxin [Sulfurimonas sp.]MDD3452330.1 type II toxin-antitoxin system RelE/ParE family toxin [Sulfurimonas sp.]
MQIVKDRKFLTSLQSTLEFIAKDSLHQALLFNSELNEKMNSLEFMPFKFRKSLYHADANIRDLIYKGYCIPYLVEDEKIVILNIFKSNQER